MIQKIGEKKRKEFDKDEMSNKETSTIPQNKKPKGKKFSIDELLQSELNRVAPNRNKNSDKDAHGR